MSNELNLSLGQTGQSITANLYLAGSVVQSGIACAEVVGQGGYYSGSMPAIATGFYDVQFFQNGQLVASGNIGWNGTAEINIQTAMQATSYTAPHNANIDAIYAKLPSNNIADETLVISATTSIMSAIGSPLQAGNYSTPPTVTQIATAVWQDITTSNDFSNSNSIGKLLAGYVAPPTITAIQAGLATTANVTAAQSAIIAAIPTPPTSATISTAILTDAFSGSDFGTAGSLGAMLKSLNSKLPVNAIADQSLMLNAIGSPLQTSANVTVGGYASGQDPMSLLFTTSNKLQVNADHTAAATTGSNVAIQNNITIPAAIAQASQTPGQITVVRGDTLSVALPALGNISSRTKLTFTVKLSSATLSNANTDSQSILQVIEGTGLTILNGSVAPVTSDGSLTCTNVTTGALVLVLAPDATSQLPVEDLVWDCQWIGPTGVATPVAGTLSIIPDVTQSII